MENTYTIKLADKLQKGNTSGVVADVHSELGQVIADSKGDFVLLLNNYDIDVDHNDSEIELVNAYTENLDNKDLLMGVAYLVNEKNAKSGADGETEVNDLAVKSTYKVLDDYFNASGDAVGAVAGAVSQLANLGQGFQQSSNKAMLAKKQEAKQQLLQTLASQKQAQQEAKIKETEQRQKTLRNVIIASSVVVGVSVIAGIIIYFKTKRK